MISSRWRSTSAPLAQALLVLPQLGCGGGLVAVLAVESGIDEPAARTKDAPATRATVADSVLSSDLIQVVDETIGVATISNHP